MANKTMILSPDLQEEIPKLVAVSFQEEEAMTLTIKVHQSWHIIEHLLLFVITLGIFVAITPLLSELTTSTLVLFLVVGAVLVVTILPLIVWIGGHNQIKLTQEGIEQRLYVGQWRLARVRKVPWYSVQMIALVMTGNARSYQEIQVLRGEQPTFWFKNYYTTEQLFYLEKCLQLYWKNYQRRQEEPGSIDGVDCYDHLIE